MRALGAWIFAGGFTLGVKQHFDIRCVMEESPFGVNTARHNMPEIPVHIGIGNWPIDQLKSEGNIDFLYGNPPCFSAKTRVLTATGSSYIQDLVRSRSTEEIVSISENGERVLRPITGWHENPYTGPMYDVARVNAFHGGKNQAKARCTPEHRFLTTTGWKRAIDLSSEDKVLNGDLRPNDQQMALIDGMLLGDAGINSAGSWIYTGQTSYNYIDLKRSALSSFASSEKIYEYSPLSWLWLKIGQWSHRERGRWYDSDGKKIVPRDVRLTPLSLAAWYMDDGTYHHYDRPNGTGVLCTDNFTQEDVDFLIGSLNELGIDARRLGSGKTEYREKYPRILITVKGMPTFIKMIGPYVLPEMRYKLPDWAPSYDQSLWNLGTPSLDWDHVVVSQNETYDDQKVYCLDVDETHNFVTYGGVVHNCAAWSSAGGSAIQGRDWRIDPRVKCTRRLFALLEELQPTAWAWESVVPAFIRGRELVDELTLRAVELGYSVTYLFHNSMHLGVPQQRRRFFMVCSKVKFDVADEFCDIIPADYALRQLNDPGIPQERDLKRFMPLIPYMKPGETMLKAWQRETPKPWPLNSRGQVQGRPNITLGRCPVGRPSQVIMSELVHPTEDRGLSMKELATLCGYPPDYEFVGSGAPQQLGRGVCPPVGEWLARNVRRCIERGEVDEAPIVKSIDCRDLPMVVQLLPLPPPPEPGASEKPWNYTKPDQDQSQGQGQDGHGKRATMSFGDHLMPVLPAATSSYRNERSLTADQRNTLSLPEGVVSLEVPENLSEDSYMDFKDWIELMFKRIERRMKRAAETPVPATEEAA